ncbi:MAG: cation-efflux pump [Myxococcota bacterium]|jgi:cation diffusion facilitator family transporter
MEENKGFHHADAITEKRNVAAVSVAVAVALTGGKLAVGLISGSLGILSEALHSALDLVAALVTFFAVRASAKPADPEHAYGHGKIENISALFETLLLLLTCVWIIIEASERLMGKDVKVDASYITFIVMAVSIVLDVGRSRALSRVAKKYNSQALEADALHFSTDVYSSSVVIFGLVLVFISTKLNIPWLANADSVAALLVAAIVIWISIKLGRRSIGDLMDEAPKGLVEKIEKTCQAHGVTRIVRTRVRTSGPQTFTDITVRVPYGTSLGQGHTMAHQIEREIVALVPGADVVVHVEPEDHKTGHAELSIDRIRLAAEACGLYVHNVRIVDMGGRFVIEFHAEVPAALSISKAHEIVSCLETDLKKSFPQIDYVVSHIEPSGTACSSGTDESLLLEVKKILQEVVDTNGMARGFDMLLVNRIGREVNIAFTCLVEPGITVAEAHHCTELLEREILAKLNRVGTVNIHVEPTDGIEGKE